MKERSSSGYIVIGGVAIGTIIIAALGYLIMWGGHVEAVASENTKNIATVTAVQSTNYSSIDKRLGNLEEGQKQVIGILLKK